MAWSEDDGDAALQHGDWEGLQRAVLLALPCWRGAQQHPAEPSRSAVSLTFCCASAPLPIALVYRHMWKKRSTWAECCDNSSCWPQISINLCPCYTLKSFQSPKGSKAALQGCLLFRLISISSDTLCKAFKLERKRSVVFVSRAGWSGVLMPQQLEIQAKSFHPFYFCVLIVGMKVHCKSCWQLCQPLGTQSTSVWTPISPVYEKCTVAITKNVTDLKPAPVSQCFSINFSVLWNRLNGGEFFCFRQHCELVPL